MKKRKKLIGAIISAVVLVALIVGAVYLIAHKDIFSDGGFDSMIQKVFHSKEKKDDKIYFDVYSESTFASMDDMLAVASDAGISVYDTSGERTAAYNVQLRSPHVTCGDAAALVWTSGDKVIYCVRDGETIGSFDASGDVIGAKMNKNGWFVVSSEDAGYKAAATVYDAAGAAVYKWFSGEGYLIDAAVAPGNQRLAVSTITENGARLLSFSLDNETGKGEFTAEDTLFIEIGFMSDSRICALSEHALYFLPFNLSSSDVYDYPEEYLRNFSFEGDGFAALLLGKYRTGNDARLVTVDDSGREIASAELTCEVLSMTTSGKYTAVAFADDSVVVYNEKLEPVLEKTGLIGLRGAYVRSDGSAVVVTAAEAYLIND